MAEKNDRKKRATAAAVAAMTAGSVVVGGLFSDPDDLLQNDAPAPITATLDASGDGGNGDDDSGAATENEEQAEAERRFQNLSLGIAHGVEHEGHTPHGAESGGL